VKVSQSVRSLYARQCEVNELLAREVKELFEGAKRPEWFYHGRVKGLESFALKLETGRVDDPTKMEDFFACTLVVENRSAIDEAVAIVHRFCTELYRRPSIPMVTHKSPDSFPFDDLRLYVRLTPSELLPPTVLGTITFEVQVKTFLQHAWAIATHDLVYKGANLEWGRRRVAYQIKAMLEHAEVSIDQSEVIAGSGALAVSDRRTTSLKQVLSWLESEWSFETLPHDRLRLAENVCALSAAMDIPLDDLMMAVREDTERGLGVNTVNLSPYGVIITALLRQRSQKVRSFLTKPRIQGRPRLFVIDEMEMSQALVGARAGRVVTIPPAEPHLDLTSQVDDPLTQGGT
jgi:hypothetical protein